MLIKLAFLIKGTVLLLNFNTGGSEEKKQTGNSKLGGTESVIKPVRVRVQGLNIRLGFNWVIIK